jgi:ABC-type branched-subunit amino acid transport system ATPase component
VTGTEPPTQPVLLRVENLSHSFGGVQAVQACSLEVAAGSITALIGPNGAGKSTLVDVVAGARRIQAGRIGYDGHNVTGWSSHRLALAGLIRTSQVARGFGRLTVTENMLVASQKPGEETVWNALRRRGRGAEQARLIEVFDLLDEFSLYSHRDAYADELSGGQRRLLELARAAVAKPKLLLLDEPMAGVNPALIEKVKMHVAGMRERGVTVLLIEHNLAVVEAISDIAIVMIAGKIAASGQMAELRADRVVGDAYLGR